jgi:hypothetical protein
MSVIIELDEKFVAEIDAAAKDFNKDRLQYISESLPKDLRRRKLSEEEIGGIYSGAYGKRTVQTDEFEIEDEQMEEFWKQI